jgi:hypothetical protein
MKNFTRLFGIIALVAVIGFSMTACEQESEPEGDSSTAGRLTITGLSSYNGKQLGTALFYPYTFSGDYSLNTTPNNNFTDYSLPTINGGSCTVYVWKQTLSGNSVGEPKSYTGNDQNVKYDVDIKDGANFVASGTVTVNFTNGIGSGAFVPNP